MNREEFQQQAMIAAMQGLLAHHGYITPDLIEIGMRSASLLTKRVFGNNG